MRYRILFCFALLLAPSAFATPAQAQAEDGCTQWWCRWGLARDTVDARVETMRSSYDVDIPVETEERVCVKWDLIENEVCYTFGEDGLSGYSTTSFDQSVDEIGEELVRAAEVWGNPVAYYADSTRVESWEQAVRLASPRAEARYRSEEIGTVYRFVIDTSGKGSSEGALTQVEIYRPEG